MTEYIYGTDEHEGHWLTGEEIVRCRDCEHAVHFFPWITPSKRSKVEVWTCRWAAEGFDIEPEGFCAWGERKE